MRKPKVKPSDIKSSLNVELFCRARAEGKNLTEAAREAGHPRSAKDAVSKMAGYRLQKKPGVRELIHQYQKEVIDNVEEQDLAVLTKDAYAKLKILLYDSSVTPTTHVKVCELILRATGQLNNDAQSINVQVLQIGEEQRQELRDMRADHDLQKGALNKIRAMTLATNGENKNSDAQADIHRLLPSAAKPDEARVPQGEAAEEPPAP